MASASETDACSSTSSAAAPSPAGALVALAAVWAAEATRKPCLPALLAFLAHQAVLQLVQEASEVDLVVAVVLVDSVGDSIGVVVASEAVSGVVTAEDSAVAEVALDFLGEVGSAEGQEWALRRVHRAGLVEAAVVDLAVV